MAKKHPTRKWPYKFIEVVWRDIVSNSKWRSTLKTVKPAIIHERGWLIEENDEDDYILVSAQLTEVDDEDKVEAPHDIYVMGMSTTIPRGCIVSIKEVK